MTDISLLSGISGLSFGSPFLSLALFFYLVLLLALSGLLLFLTVLSPDFVQKTFEHLLCIVFLFGDTLCISVLWLSGRALD